MDLIPRLWLSKGVGSNWARFVGMKHKKRSYDRGAKWRGGPPIVVPYDVLEDAGSMKRFLKDLIAWTLARWILPRQASACRACLETSLRVFVGVCGGK